MSDLADAAAAEPRPRILYVDDDEAEHSTLSSLLGDAYSVSTHSSTSEALSLLEWDGDFAVVIAAVRMPQRNGLQFLNLVKEASPTTTRVALIALSELDSAALPSDSSFRIITQPCAPQLLLKTVADAVDYHQLIASSPLQPVEPSEQEPSAAPPPPAAAHLPEVGSLVEQKAPPRAAPPLVQREPEVRFTTARGKRLGLRVLGRTIELLPGRTVLGRSRSCHIALKDPKISRRHACFWNDGMELTIQNSSATNPLLINGVALTSGTRALRAGDRITLGAQELEVCAMGDYFPSLEPTERMSLLALGVDPDLAGDAATLDGVARVAEKFLRLGQGRDAERILRPPLEGLLRHCRGRRASLPSDLQLAVRLALDLAESTRAGSWISYVFDLLSAVERPADEDAIERLYRIVPSTPGISMASFRGYLDVLDRCQDRFAPAQRFLIRRAQGLLSAVMRSAHV